MSDTEHLILTTKDVYTTAAGLFDPADTLDIDSSEYTRGVVKLTARLLGRGDYEVAAEIGMHMHRVDHKAIAQAWVAQWEIDLLSGGE